MSDEEKAEEKPFAIEVAKLGRANCRKCKQKCDSGAVRIAKLAYNPFGGDGGKMKQWHHVDCLFEVFLNQRPKTKRLDDIEELDGWDNLDEDNQNEFLVKWDACEKKLKDKWGDKLPPRKEYVKKTSTESKTSSPVRKKEKTKPSCDPGPSTSFNQNIDLKSKDCLFRQFRRLVADITNESSYLEKTAIVKKMLTKGSDEQEFKGDVIQWCRLLLPGVVKRVYNLQSKQLIKLFSKIFNTDQDEMLEDLEQGDIGETIQKFFEESKTTPPNKKSLLTIQEVDDFLEELSTLTKEDEQTNHFKKIVKKCTSNDLKIIIRLIKHDLRMNAGAKHILDAIHPTAYEAFQSSRDLPSVLKRLLESDTTASDSTSMKAMINIMTPVLPMLAEACKSVDQAMKKCPNGMYSEIKYDGERVQVHKKGNDFKYFSRSLKPVMPHKVNHFKDYIPQAFPYGKDLILDAEVLMVDTHGKPLPFGSLGVHKKEAFKNATVCLFVFDCIYFNGDILAYKPMKERRKILEENMVEIENHVMFSEVQEIFKAEDLASMIAKVLKLGLEGLVLKDLRSIYEPGKRHWLKVKKDYLCDGAMADTADLIVLGAWFGTGKKGGMMSVFLMGVYDERTNTFLTVTKVHTGHDDKTLEKLQTELDMVKISSDMSKVPSWLKCTKTMVPDFVARDPKKQPVWEITGAEFTQHDVHTADGISIRFPRVTKIRDDKNWIQATNLEELRNLFKTSKEKTDYHEILTKNSIDLDVKTSPSKDKKQKTLTEFVDEENRRVDKETDVKKPKKVTHSMKTKYETHLKNSSSVLESDDESKMKRRSSDSSESFEAKRIKIELERDLFPTIFTSTRAYFTDDTENLYKDIFRHFLAVGGEAVDDSLRDTATHVIHKENEVSESQKNEFSSNTRHVIVDWVRDSIGNGMVQDTKPYAVTLIPSVEKN